MDESYERNLGSEEDLGIYGEGNMRMGRFAPTRQAFWIRSWHAIPTNTKGAVTAVANVLSNKPKKSFEKHDHVGKGVSSFYKITICFLKVY